MKKSTWRGEEGGETERGEERERQRVAPKRSRKACRLHHTARPAAADAATRQDDGGVGKIGVEGEGVKDGGDRDKHGANERAAARRLHASPEVGAAPHAPLPPRLGLRLRRAGVAAIAAGARRRQRLERRRQRALVVAVAMHCGRNARTLPARFRRRRPSGELHRGRPESPRCAEAFPRCPRSPGGRQVMHETRERDQRRTGKRRTSCCQHAARRSSRSGDAPSFARASPLCLFCPLCPLCPLKPLMP